MATIPNQRQIHTSLLVSRPDGVTWVDVAPYLSKVTAERGDVTRVGVGGADGVLNLLKFDLHNDGTMMPSWRDNIEQDESYVVGDEEDDVGDEAESAATLIDLLFGAEHRYERDPFQPTDRNSAWNRNSNDEYEPLLASYREVALFLATTPIGEQPEPEDWHCPFHGYLGKRISTSGSIVSCEAKSLSKRLQDTLIETEQTYGSEEGAPAETVIQQILDANLGPGEVTLFCPVPSGSLVYPYTFKDGSVWDKIQEIAGKSGWFLGDRWDPATKQFRLTFMEPPIDKDENTADYFFAWTDDFYIQELDITDEHYRNAVIIEYWDEEAKEVRTVTADKPDPIRRAMKIGLGKAPLIRTAVEATRLANQALHDVSDDSVVCRVTMPLLPQLDTFDGVVIDNPRVSSTKDFFGVESVRHELDFNTDRFVTEFIGSGRVVGGRHKWRKMQTRPGAYLPTAPEDVSGGGVVMPTPVGVIVSPVIEGLSVYVPEPGVHSPRWATTEVHVSDTDGFTPGDETLAASNRATRFSVDGLEGGKTYYVQTVYVDIDGKRGPFSEEVARATREAYTPDLTPTDPPTLDALTAQALDLGGGRYDVSVTIPFTMPDRGVRIVIERRERTSVDPEVWTGWLEVGQATTSPWVDRGGLNASKTYQYRARAESSAGVRSNLSNVRQITIDAASVVPPNVTGLVADFTGPDCVVTWNPVAGATEYKVRISDGVGERGTDRRVTATNYRYTLAENVADGSPPEPSLTVELWAVNAFGNESLTPASVLATNLAPAKPTIRLESSLTQLRWEITSPLPADWEQTSVTVGSFSTTVPTRGGVIDLVQAGVADGAQAQATVSIWDVFGQESTDATATVDAIYATERDLAGAIFQVEYESDQFPGGADPATLYDNDPTTGITFAQAPEIIVKHPKEERIGMLHLDVDQAVDGYVQVRRVGETTWHDVIGSEASPYSFHQGENVVGFAGLRIVVAKEVRIVLLDPVRVNECTPQIYLIANHALVGTLSADRIEIGRYANSIDFNTADLWHFDTHLKSTQSLEPEAGADAVLEPGGGKFGGAVSVVTTLPYEVGESTGHTTFVYRATTTLQDYADLTLQQLEDMVVN